LDVIKQFNTIDAHNFKNMLKWVFSHLTFCAKAKNIFHRPYNVKLQKISIPKQINDGPHKGCDKV
jgi:hypothetical protein